PLSPPDTALDSTMDRRLTLSTQVYSNGGNGKRHQSEYRNSDDARGRAPLLPRLGSPGQSPTVARVPHRWPSGNSQAHCVEVAQARPMMARCPRIDGKAPLEKSCSSQL